MPQVALSSSGLQVGLGRVELLKGPSELAFDLLRVVIPDLHLHGIRLLAIGKLEHFPAVLRVLLYGRFSNVLGIRFKIVKLTFTLLTEVFKMCCLVVRQEPTCSRGGEGSQGDGPPPC